jgi:hypothetical protein
MSATYVAPAKARGGVIAGVSGRLRTFVCGLGGHDVLLNFEPGRLSLRCTSCQYETPGWTLKEPAARPERQRRPVLLEQNAQSRS